MKLAREMAMDKKKPDCSAPYISYAFKQLLISIVKIAFLSEKTAITEDNHTEYVNIAPNIHFHKHIEFSLLSRS